MSRPDPEDIFAHKPGLFSWVRDRAYDFVYYELGAGLDFVGDLFRGPSGYSQSLHRQTDKAQTRAPAAKPLTKADQAIFVEMLRRKPSEPQIAYWKRKKALLNNPDKLDLVRQQRALDSTLPKPDAQIIVDAPARSNPLARSDAPKQTKSRTRR